MGPESIDSEIEHADELLSSNIRSGIAADQGRLDAFIQAVTSTRWDGSVETCRIMRNQICDILNIRLPQRKSKFAVPKASNSDTLDCYSALVRDAGY